MEEPQNDQTLEQVPFWTDKRVVLAQTLVFSVIIAALTVGFIRNQYISGTLTIVNIFGWGVCILAWIKADARERGYALYEHFPIIVVAFGTVALIYYLFRSRGFAGGLVGVAYFVLFAIAMLTFCVIVGIIILLITVLISGPGILLKQ